MKKVMAWERLNNPEYSGRLNMNQFYDLLREAGYSDEVSQRAARKRGWERLEAGVKL